MPNFNRHCVHALLGLSLIGCNSESTSNTDQSSVYIPYNLNELPKPNDGYGYDNDLTISGVDEPAYEEQQAYHQDFNNSYAALDGWGLCAEPILIPIEQADSEQRHPLNQESLKGNVVLMNSSGESIPTKLSSTGSEIKIECESSLKYSEKHYLVVTDGVKTESDEPLQADPSFEHLLGAEIEELTPEQQKLRVQIDDAIEMTGAGTAVYAAQFTTQDSYAVLDAIVEKDIQEAHMTGELVFMEDTSRHYDFYRQTLNLPFYLPFTESEEENCTLDKYDLKNACPALYKWMTAEDGGFLTHDNPTPEIVEMQDVEVDIYVPNNWNETDQLPTIIFVHGVTGDKGTVATMLKDFTKDGYAVVAIDMPYHGTRIRYGQGDPEQEISARADKSYFINIDSPLALRSNLQQTVSDFISLRSALHDFSWVDQNNVHLIGLSLGGITSVMITEFTQNTPEYPNREDTLGFKTANFVVPGQGLTNLVLNSHTLRAETTEGVKKSADVQRSIAETVIPDICTESAINEECIVALDEFVAASEENAITVAQLEDDIWQLIEPELLQGVQPTIDSADPASFTARQTRNGQPTLLLEAVGNCGETCEVGEYMPDTVVPNSADNNIRTGTDPLIKALDLAPITEETTFGNPIRGVVRATTGGHGTYMFPYEGPMDETGFPSIPTGDVMNFVWDATATQQEIVASMVKSDAYQVEINNLEHVQTEVAEDEK